MDIDFGSVVVVGAAAVGLWQLAELVRYAKTLSEQGAKTVAIGQDILAAIEAENTVIDSFIALVQGLVATSVIPAETANAIFQSIADQRAEVEAAILASTQPAGGANAVLKVPTVIGGEPEGMDPNGA